MQTLEKQYPKEEVESSLRKTVVFKRDKVTLVIPEDGIKLSSGWSIVPMAHPASVSLMVRKGKQQKLLNNCKTLTTSIAISKYCSLHNKIVEASVKMRPQSACIIPYHCCHFHAQLTQSEVDSYCDSIPPSCQLELHFQRMAQPYERLSHHIKVSGIQGISSITIARDIDPGKIKAIEACMCFKSN